MKGLVLFVLVFVCSLAFQGLIALEKDCEEIPICYVGKIDSENHFTVCEETSLEIVITEEALLEKIVKVKDLLRKRLRTSQSNLLLVIISPLVFYDQNLNRNDFKIWVTFKDGHRIREKIINSMSFPAELKKWLEMLHPLPADKSLCYFGVFEEEINWNEIEVISLVFRDPDSKDEVLSPLFMADLLALPPTD